MEMEQRLDPFDERYGGRIDAMARFMKDFVDSTDRRISTLELNIHPVAILTEAQATEVMLAVRAVGQALTGADRGRDGYGQAHTAMYRRYRISSYKNLPQGKFEEVMAWLHQWHQELAGESPGT